MENRHGPRPDDTDYEALYRAGKSIDPHMTRKEVEAERRAHRKATDPKGLKDRLDRESKRLIGDWRSTSGDQFWAGVHISELTAYAHHGQRKGGDVNAEHWRKKPDEWSQWTAKAIVWMTQCFENAAVLNDKENEPYLPLREVVQGLDVLQLDGSEYAERIAAIRAYQIQRLPRTHGAYWVDPRERSQRLTGNTRSVRNQRAWLDQLSKHYSTQVFAD